jgi:NCAIR mutase (PurE)-related protein
MPYRDLGFAKVDHHRALRKGFPEVVYGQGKTPEQVARLATVLLEWSDTLLVTRAAPEVFARVEADIEDAVYDELARTIVVDRREIRELYTGVVVASGGTSDGPVAQEAAVTAELMGCRVERLSDVGVAGIHRLFDKLDVLQGARVVVAIAGMEGALPSVIGGLVKAPVIAVPTSVGYGASFGGIAALLAMLNSCAPGVCVVNIDNGFGAGYLAAVIAKSAHGAASDPA